MASTDYTETALQPEVIDAALSDEMSDDEFNAMFDARARELLGMSGDEFIEKLNAGEVAELDHSSVVMLEMMIPFLARQT